MFNVKICDEFIESFNKNLSYGIKYAKMSNVAITGLCRNVEKRLEKNLKYIDELAGYFNSCYYFFYENDSEDATPEILKLWSNSTNKNYLSQKLNSTHPIGPQYKSKSRTIALADYRNICKNYIQTNYNVDYVIVMDLDFQTVSIDGILHSFGYLSQNQIKAMCGNSFIYYQKEIINYDSWAYRYNWWNDYQEYIMSWFPSWHPMVGSNPIKVNSAFGGSCIYNSIYYLDADCMYEGYDCEHVCFHKNLYKKFPEFNLSLNPSQIMIM